MCSLHHVLKWPVRLQLRLCIAVVLSMLQGALCNRFWYRSQLYVSKHLTFCCASTCKLINSALCTVPGLELQAKTLAQLHS